MISSVSALSSTSALSLLQATKPAHSGTDSNSASVQPTLTGKASGGLSVDTMFSVLNAAAAAKTHDAPSAAASPAASPSPAVAATTSNGARVSASGITDTAAYLNGIIQKSLAMTSQEVSDAMYSGKGIPTLALTGADDSSPYMIDKTGLREGTVTMSQWISGLYQYAQSIKESAPLFQPDQRDFLINDAAKIVAEADGMRAAFDKRTLIFQQAAEVDGLNFEDSIKYIGGDNDTLPQMTGGIQINAEAGISDGRQHAFIGENTGAYIFLTWVTRTKFDCLDM